jgi:hypothetical protein
MVGAMADRLFIVSLQAHGLGFTMLRHDKGRGEASAHACYVVDFGHGTDVVKGLMWTDFVHVRCTQMLRPVVPSGCWLTNPFIPLVSMMAWLVNGDATPRQGEASIASTPYDLPIDSIP